MKAKKFVHSFDIYNYYSRQNFMQVDKNFWNMFFKKTLL